ncbi:MAG: SIMPL domain-containing protein [Novosphingobium sp.]|nr:SIMPL domain-containing protein [Novosphingobium sp.]
MKRFALALLCALALPSTAVLAQAAPPVTIAPGNTLLTVSADGRSLRTPDLAVFSAGVTSSGKTAGEALRSNAADMSRVVAALKRAGIADRDIQTSNLSLNPVYAPPVQRPDGQYDQPEQRIVGYQANNTVTVRQRKLGEFGRVIDTLVEAGANQVNGPSFQMDEPDAASDEARLAAMTKARARAELYAGAAGLRVVRILSISESGGYNPGPPVIYARMAADSAQASSPVAAGEIQLNANVTVMFELAP